MMIQSTADDLHRYWFSTSVFRAVACYDYINIIFRDINVGIKGVNLAVFLVWLVPSASIKPESDDRLEMIIRWRAPKEAQQALRHGDIKTSHFLVKLEFLW